MPFLFSGGGHIIEKDGPWRTRPRRLLTLTPYSRRGDVPRGSIVSTMKFIAAVVILLAATTALALDISTRDGRTFRDVTIREVSPAGIRIFHSAGIETLDFSQLPDDLQERFHYDPKLGERDPELAGRQAYDAYLRAVQEARRAAAERAAAARRAEAERLAEEQRRAVEEQRRADAELLRSEAEAAQRAEAERLAEERYRANMELLRSDAKVAPQFGAERLAVEERRADAEQPKVDAESQSPLDEDLQQRERDLRRRENALLAREQELKKLRQQQAASPPPVSRQEPRTPLPAPSSSPREASVDSTGRVFFAGLIGIISVIVAFRVGVWRHYCKFSYHHARWQLPVEWCHPTIRIGSFVLVLGTTVIAAIALSRLVTVLTGPQAGSFAFVAICYLRWQASRIVGRKQARSGLAPAEL